MASVARILQRAAARTYADNVIPGRVMKAAHEAQRVAQEQGWDDIHCKWAVIFAFRKKQQAQAHAAHTY